MGHAEAYALGDVVARYWVQRGYNVHAPDRLGRLRPARRERRHQARRRPARLDLREHRARRRRRCAATPAPSTGTACCTPATRSTTAGTSGCSCACSSAGLAYRKAVAGQLVPERPDRAGQRAGRRRPLRALRHPGHQEEADPVVLQDHRLRRPAAGRHEPAGGQLAGQGAAHAAQLDRPLHRRRGRVRDRGPRRAGRPSTRRAPTRCSARRSSWWRADSDLAAELAAGTPAEARVRRRTSSRCSGRPRSSGWPPTATKTGVFLHRLRDQPGQRRAAAGLGRRLRAGRLRHTARSWPCPPTTSATWTSRARSTCRCGVVVGRPTSERPAGDRRGDRGDGVLVNSGPLDGLRKDEAIDRRSSSWLEEQRPGAAAVNYRLRDWLISRQRYWGTPDPDHPLPGLRRGRRSRTTSCRSSCRDAEGLDLTPKGTSPLGGGRRTGSSRRARAAAVRRARDTDTMDTFVDSSWYFLRFVSTRTATTCRSTRPRCDEVAAGRPVRRRRHARDPAPAVRPLLHQGAARPGHGRRSSSRSPRC